MFRVISNVPIPHRLIIILSIATIIPIIAIILLGNFYLQSLSIRSQSVQISFAAQNIASQEQVNLQRMNALLEVRFAQMVAQSSPTLGGDPSLEASGELTNADIAALEINFDQTLASYRQTYEIATSSNMSVIRDILVSDTPDHGHQVMTEQANALNAVTNTDWGLYRTAQTKVLTELTDPHFKFETVYADFYQANLDFLNLRTHWQQVVDASTSMGTAVTRIGPSLTNPLIIYTSGALIFTFLMIIAALVLIITTIVNPLRALVALTRRIAQGETHARAEIRGTDEISQVSGSINAMLDVIVRLMQEAQFLHTDLQTHIEKLIHEVSGVGEGDLRKQARVENNELGPLARSFNGMTGELSNLVVKVKSLARGVQVATLQAFGHIEQLTDHMDIQAQQIYQATREVDQMTTTNQKVAERALVLYTKAQEAFQITQSGRKAIQQTTTSMSRMNSNIHAASAQVASLGDRSREINTIVEVIASIAQQTNRLALDAAVQAATAGEDGKGFGAVASDIRRLAERAKEQTMLIGQVVVSVLEDINNAKRSIQATEQDTASGAFLTRQVETALEAIFAVVEQQANEIEVTNREIRQQLQSSTTAVQIMQQVSESGKQSHMNTREAMQQVERLAQLAGQLLTSVEVFKLRDMPTPTPPPFLSNSRPLTSASHTSSLQHTRESHNKLKKVNIESGSPSSAAWHQNLSYPETSSPPYQPPLNAAEQHKREM